MKVAKYHPTHLVNSVLFNLLGQSAPLLAALYSIPLLIKGLGVDRFGIFTLIWIVVGYFGLFDLGIGRAMTKLVAERFDSERTGEIPGIFWTGMSIVLLSGLVGALLLFAGTPWLVRHVLNAPLELQAEALPAFHLLALAIPIVIVISGLTGFLEASHRFGLINAVRIPMGIFSFLGPLLVLPYSNNLYALTAILLAGRVVEFIAYFSICMGVLPALRNGITLRVENIKTLLAFGGWVTVTSIIGPILTQLDRFLVGALISVSAIAYYATPYSIISKLLIIPSALVCVLFPTFSLLLIENRTQAAQMFYRGTKYVFFAMFPLVLILLVFAHEGLALWLGEEFSLHSTTVLQWLVIGIFMNGLAQLPVALVQGNGRPELVAQLHLVELPFYILALVWLLKHYGIMGAAMVGVGRIMVDTVVLFLFARKLVPETSFVDRQVLKFVLVSFVAFVLAANITLIFLKILFCLFVIPLFLYWAWLCSDSGERQLLMKIRNKILHHKTSC